MKDDLGLKIICALAAIGLLLLAFTARSQTPEPPPDMPIIATAGVFPQVKCHTPVDTDLASVCWVRTDVTPIVELGCTPSLGPDMDVPMDLTVVATPGDDAELRCYVIDTSGLVSDYSPNAATVDFTKPGTPYVVGQ